MYVYIYIYVYIIYKENKLRKLITHKKRVKI